MFESNTYNTILERMLASVSDKLDKREGSVIFDTLSPTALELQFLYIELERIIREAYGDTASREFLILRCRERGITPYAATNAILKGEFTPTDIDVTGRRFSVEDLNFVVGEKISDGVYMVRCETAGIIGNQYLGTMIPIDYVNGLATAELTEILIPGEDEEDTEELRKRYFDSFEQKAFGGNVRDYIEKTKSIAGVGGVKVTRVWNGDFRPADFIPNDEVTKWYEAIRPTLESPVREWLEGLYSAAIEKKLTVGGTVKLTIINSEFDIPSKELVDSVQTAIDPVRNAGEGVGLAPIGHVVNVKAATAIPIEIKTKLEFKSGYGWMNLQETINSVISDYLLELRREWAESDSLTVRLSQIDTRLLAIDGIVDISGTVINGNPENLTLGKFEVPVFGGVSSE
ncbi:MAG: baseplate J/gp47 family protein [Oscillospiraceae bacterium]|nr:baseplate J/gp47 family protein [Oscillospiraceae bacterium]